MRPRLLAVLAGAATLAATACAQVGDDRQLLVAAIGRTLALSRTYSYSETAGGRVVTVAGTVEDDFRYSVSAQVNGKPAATEVVRDDARSLQVTDGALLDAMVRSSVAPTAATSAASPTPSPASPARTAPAASPKPGTAPAAAPAPPAPSVPAELRQGKAVLDAKGGSALVATGAYDPRRHGLDPLYDSLAVLDYARTAVQQGASATRFNPESQDYRPKYDPFPKPTSGITRYDIDPPALTPRDATVRGTVLPPLQDFRRLAVYVKGGLVVEVRERISVRDMLADPRTHIASHIADYGVRLPAGASLDQQAAAILATFNAATTAAGTAPALPERDLDAVFSDLGAQLSVETPDGTPGDLSGVGYHGQVLGRHL